MPAGEFEFSDYGVFGDAINDAKTLNEQIEEFQNNMNDVRNILGDQSVFMGPVCDITLEGLQDGTSKMQLNKQNFDTVAKYIQTASNNYQSGDQEASKLVLQTNAAGSLAITEGGQYMTGSSPITSIAIPENLAQSGYTVTCYGEKGWHLGGSANPTAIASSSNQKLVHNAWLQDGARYKNGIAVMNVNGQDHYLVATAPTFGKVGDTLNVRLQNGQNIPCVLADSKSQWDANYTTYGHSNGSSVNVLEFEVDRNVYNSTGNPSTATWGLEWDSNSRVSVIDNYGSII